MGSFIKFVLNSFTCFCVIWSNILPFCNGLENRSNITASYVVKLRGLPWSVTVEDIVNFFDGCRIKNGTQGIHLIMTKEGRPSGIAYIDMETEVDFEMASKKHHQYLGDRFIEVFQATRGEMERTKRRSQHSIQRAMTDACVRIRGLPYKTSEQDILNFFEGLDIIPNGISLVYNANGKPTGVAYVQFIDQEMAERALQRDKGRLYHRYIEVFRSSLGEVRLALQKQYYHNQPSEELPHDMHNGAPVMNNYKGYKILKPLRLSGYPDKYSGREQNTLSNTRYNKNYEKPDYKSYTIHMRGLPFNATQDDIVQFFSPLEPIYVDIYFSSRGRAIGQADVTFKTHEDMKEAMTKNNSYMKHRYIELFE